MDDTETHAGADTMQSTPRVVFIHGVKGRKKRKEWLKPLNRSLRSAGIEAFDRAEVPDVRYRRYLSGRRDKKVRRSRGAPAGAATKAAYAANQDELRRVLRDYRKSPKSPITKAPKAIRHHSAWMIRKLWPFKDAERYRRRRERVCAEIMKQMGHGEFIIIGHSLGSVVAADLLTRLAPDQHVRLLVTIGSPLGAGDWSRTWKTLSPFPFGKVDAWVNVYNPWDVVTGGVGLRKRTRRVIDIPTKPFGAPTSFVAQHKIKHYVSHPAVAMAIRWSMTRPPSATARIGGDEKQVSSMADHR